MNRFVSPRRTFLRGSAAALAALPLVPLPTDAADGDYPKRIIWVFTPNGTVMDELWPTEDFSFGQILAPLEPFKQRIAVMRGIDMESAYVEPKPKDHWPDFMNALTGRQGLINSDATCRIAGISVDQHIAQNLGDETQYPSLQLGVQCTKTQARVSALGPDQPIAPVNNPTVAFESLFSELDLDPLGQAKLKAERTSVLDLVKDEISAAECQLVGADREKFQRHLAAVEQLENSLGHGGSGAFCAVPEIADIDHESEAGFADVVGQQLTIASMAIACDLTRVMTIQLSHSGSQLQHVWLDIEQSHHGIAHGSEGVVAGDEQRREWSIQIDRWYAEQFLALLQQLDAIDEGGASALDHSLVIWAHEQQKGSSHDRRDMPYVLAGGLHGTVELGRRVDCGGVPHNRMLVSLANLMGVPTDEFGDPALSNGGLAQLPY